LNVDEERWMSIIITAPPPVITSWKRTTYMRMER
jgi:hypothetical protein